VSLAVLLVACINIANLLLAREARGRRDLGIRLALGISRGRLAAHVLVEVLLLALVGGMLALLIAGFTDSALERLLLTDTLADDGATGLRVVVFTGILATGAALLTAALPAAQSLRADVQQALRTSAGGITRSTARLRGTLVVAQVTLSAVLLVGAALFVRSFSAAATSDLGVDLADTWYATLVWDTEHEPADGVAFHTRAIEALRSVPGVRAAGASSTYPFYQQHGTALRAEGWDSLPGRVLVHTVAGDYFDALGMTIGTGRSLVEADRTGAPQVAVVNRVMAARLWNGQALGRCLYIGADETRCTRIVGVTEDARVGGVGVDPPMQYYVPALQQVPADPLFTLLFRAEPGASPRIEADVRRVLLAIDPGIRAADVSSVASILDSQMRPWRLGAILFSAFGGLALVVAVLGLYGVIAFDVTQRVRELGLRAALGASPARLVRAVLGRALLLASAGLAAAVGAALLFAPLIDPFLYGVQPRDPVSLGAVSAILLAAAVLAAALPGIRASRVDPNAALRVE
jgi:predicted permease